MKGPVSDSLLGSVASAVLPSTAIGAVRKSKNRQSENKGFSLAIVQLALVGSILKFRDRRMQSENFVWIDGSTVENAPTCGYVLNRKMQMRGIGRRIAACADKAYDLAFADVIALVQVVGVLLQVRIIVDELTGG